MLDGIRIVELGTTITAPLTSLLLADCGAEVIKVERSEGDPFRGFRGAAMSPQFAAYNRNKSSVVIDLKGSPGIDKLHGLLAASDVFIDNLRPGVLAKLGLDPSLLGERHPHLIHCSITGFGAAGPDAKRPAFDAVAQALSGISSLFLKPSAPAVAGPTISDNVTGMYAAVGILAAIVERMRTGRGRRIEVNMLESSIAFIPDAFTTYEESGISPGPYTRTASSQSYALQCADGPMIAIHLSSIAKFWLGLCDAIERPDLFQDPRFDTRMKRVDAYFELRNILAGIFILRPIIDWQQRLTACDVPHARVSSIADVYEDPQVKALGTFFDKRDHEGIVRRAIHFPILIDGERITPPFPAPALGELLTGPAGPR